MSRLRCVDVIDLLSEYLEGGLTGSQAREVEAHLACDPCRTFLETLVKTRDAVRGLRAEDVPAECRRRLMSLIDGPDPLPGTGSRIA